MRQCLSFFSSAVIKYSNKSNLGIDGLAHNSGVQSISWKQQVTLQPQPGSRKQWEFVLSFLSPFLHNPGFKPKESLMPQIKGLSPPHLSYFKIIPRHVQRPFTQGNSSTQSEINLHRQKEHPFIPILGLFNKFSAQSDSFCCLEMTAESQAFWTTWSAVELWGQC